MRDGEDKEAKRRSREGEPCAADYHRRLDAVWLGNVHNHDIIGKLLHLVSSGPMYLYQDGGVVPVKLPVCVV